MLQEAFFALDKEATFLFGWALLAASTVLLGSGWSRKSSVRLSRVLAIAVVSGLVFGAGALVGITQFERRAGNFIGGQFLFAVALWVSLYAWIILLVTDLARLSRLRNPSVHVTVDSVAATQVVYDRAWLLSLLKNKVAAMNSERAQFERSTESDTLRDGEAAQHDGTRVTFSLNARTDCHASRLVALA